MTITSLGDIVTIVSGTTRPKIENGAIPVYGGNGILGYTNISNYSGPMICIGRVGAYCGVISFESGLLWLSDNALGVTIKNGVNADITFLRYMLEGLNLNRIHVGAAQPVITQGVLRDLRIEVPGMQTQKNIARFLSDIDAKIVANNMIIETSEKLMREIYDYWFVQFDFPDENGRPHKSSGGEMVYNEALEREIPKGWIAKELGEIIIEAKKSSVQVSEARERTGVYPFFTSGDEIIDFEDYYVDGFNIFLNTGGNADVKSYYGKSAYSTDTWCISAKDYSFMLAIFLSSIKTYLNDNCFAGSGLKHLQKNIFKQIKIVVPDVKTLDTFNSIASSIYEDISACQIENKKLASLRDWLLPMLMSGQVMVDDRILNNNASERVEDDNIGLY